MSFEERVTEEVAELYRDYPYPAHGVVMSSTARMLRDIVEAARVKVAGRPIRLLDAGCGTGELTLGIASEFKDVEVTGLDLSPASLRFAADLARRRNIPVTFLHRNLLEPLSDIGPFDIVTSVGVLHHIGDPSRALSNLRAVVNPDAWLLGMVYCEFGKRERFVVRDAISLLAPEATREQRIRFVRETRYIAEAGVWRLLGRLHPRARLAPRSTIGEAIRRVFIRRKALESIAADAYTHVQELTYTTAQMAALLDATGWSYAGWPPRSGMPASLDEVFSGSALAAMRRKSVLEQAAVLERLVRLENLYFVARAS
jgi:SAM-dependent methyltransferase